MINFVICDDSSHIVNRLSHLFESAFIKGDFDAKIVLKTTNYQDVLNFITSSNVDVVILDIQFNNSNISGLDIAEQIRKVNKKCYIIFTTSHMEYVMQAYKFKTFDYIIKNTITVDLLVETLARLFDDINGSSNEYIKIDNKGSIIDANDIQFIEKDGMKLIFHTSTKDYEIYNSFSKIENRLPNNFVRCHKSYIVNIKNIASIKISTNEITFKNKSVCYIGPKYKDSFMEVFKHDSIIK